MVLFQQGTVIFRHHAVLHGQGVGFRLRARQLAGKLEGGEQRAHRHQPAREPEEQPAVNAVGKERGDLGVEIAREVAARGEGNEVTGEQGGGAPERHAAKAAPEFALAAAEQIGRHGEGGEVLQPWIYSV